MHPPTTAMQLARIVNQLHRVALSIESVPPTCSMTVSQVSVIGYLLLRNDEEVYQKDIEQFFKLRRSTVSSMLTTMEKKGILTRQPVPHDARLKKLVLTDLGQQMSSTATQVFFKVNELMIQGLTLEEQTTLASILTKIEDNLSRAEL